MYISQTFSQRQGNFYENACVFWNLAPKIGTHSKYFRFNNVIFNVYCMLMYSIHKKSAVLLLPCGSTTAVDTVYSKEYFFNTYWHKKIDEIKELKQRQTFCMTWATLRAFRSVGMRCCNGCIRKTSMLQISILLHAVFQYVFSDHVSEWYSHHNDSEKVSHHCAVLCVTSNWSAQWMPSHRTTHKALFTTLYHKMMHKS
jgi:hypothetical protein